MINSVLMLLATWVRKYEKKITKLVVLFRLTFPV